jgi:hypothetical protein
MDNVIHPKLPQWERNQAGHDTRDDAVLSLVGRLMECLHSGIEPDVVVLASLRMVQKAVILNHQRNAGKEVTLEALRQAKELAAQYTIDGVGIDDNR